MMHGVLRGKLVGLSGVLALALGAGQAVAVGGVEAAHGVMMASIIHEKCTGDIGQPNELELQAAALTMQGFAFNDIQTGFMRGTLAAESMYPGNTRPPKAACAEATALYRGFMKSIKEMGLPVR